MLRQKFWVTLGLFIVLVVGAHTFWDRATLSASTSSTASVTFLGEQPAWANDVGQVMQDLEKWRGKSFTRPLEIQVKDRAENEPAGWYSPETHQLIVTTDGSEQFKRGVMLHEIFHALQDQNFNLLDLHQAVASPDADQALDAIIEGEAMLAVSELLNYNFTDHARLPESGEVSDAFFNRLFEYGDGMTFVRSLREQQGWDGVDQVFQHPPQSTREIYHPDLYPLSPQTPISPNKLGEYGFRLWLARAPESRAKLPQLSDAYRNDLRKISGAGEQVWEIQLSTADQAMLLTTVAPQAIAKMPNAPETFNIQQDNATLQLRWRSS